MGYFRELPLLRYPSFLSDKTSSLDYVDAKNLFRRVKLREDLQSIFTLFDKYEIPEGFRPENVAEELFGSATLDYVVIICAGIVNIRDEWPLSNADLYEYAVNKYGVSGLTDIKYYETKLVKNSNGKVILPKGKRVNQNFKLSYYDNGITYTNDLTKLGANVVSLANPVNAISNYEYETIRNEEKRNIFVLKSGFLQQFLDDLREIMVYDESTQRIDDTTAKTENLNISMP